MAKGITPTGAIVTGELVREGGDTYIRIMTSHSAMLYFVERIIEATADEIRKLREGAEE